MRNWIFSVMKCSYDLKFTLQIRSEYEIFMLCTVHIQKIAEGKCLKLKYVDNTSYIYSLMSEEPQVWGKVWWIIRIAYRWKIVGRTYLKGLFDFVAGLVNYFYVITVFGENLSAGNGIKYSWSCSYDYLDSSLYK